MMRKMKSKKAFTLVEMIVVIALMAIVGVAVSLILVSANDTVVTLSQQTDISLKTNYVMETVQTQLKYAKDLTIYSSEGEAGKDADKTYLYSKDGRIYFQQGKDGVKDLFGENFYEGYYIDIIVTRMEKSIARLSISTTSKNDLSVSYALDTAVNILNTQNIEGEAGSMVSYQWAEE